MPRYAILQLIKLIYKITVSDSHICETFGERDITAIYWIDFNTNKQENSDGKENPSGNSY